MEKGELCKILKRHYTELDKELEEQKKELQCEPLCEERYRSIYELSLIVKVFHELLVAFGCD